MVVSVLPVQGLGCRGEENTHAVQCLDIGLMKTDSFSWFGKFSVSKTLTIRGCFWGTHILSHCWTMSLWFPFHIWSLTGVSSSSNKLFMVSWALRLPILSQNKPTNQDIEFLPPSSGSLGRLAAPLLQDYFRIRLRAHDLYDLSLDSWLFWCGYKRLTHFSTYDAFNLFLVIQDVEKLPVDYVKAFFEQFKIEAVRSELIMCELPEVITTYFNVCPFMVVFSSQHTFDENGRSLKRMRADPFVNPRNHFLHVEEAGHSPDSPRNCSGLTYYQRLSSTPGNFQESKYSIVCLPAGVQQDFRKSICIKKRAVLSQTIGL